MTRVLEVAFFASMKVEESESVRCSLIYLNPERPDPTPPERIVADRWRWMALPERIPLTPGNLAKIAKSFDVAASAVAVYADGRAEPYIWGAIDQQGWRAQFMTREQSEGPESPGLLEVSIVGTGSLEVHKDYTLVAALRQGTIAVGSHDVLGQQGHVRGTLQPALDSLVARVRAAVGADAFDGRDHWDASTADDWTTALARILATVQRYGHGGALVLTPDADNTGLRIKYPLQYNRLAEAVERLAVHTIRRVNAEDEIHESYLRRHSEEMPVALYLDERVSRSDEDDTSNEVTGSIRFIASLSRVDGAVVADRSLSVRGYGGVITTEDEPNEVCVANDVAGTVARLRRIDPRHFGTRHQSMMRFCFARAGSVGFVISQDGDARAMMRVHNRLIVWEDVRLRRA